MIDERAVILSLDPVLCQPITNIIAERKTTCALRAHTSGCGNVIWGKLFANQFTAFKRQNRINAKVGDSVMLESAAGFMLGLL